MSASPLVSAAELAEHLDDPDWRIIDCRFDLKQPDAGEAAYREGHIPGALYAHLDRDLSGPITPASGRHPLPDPHTLCATFSRWGIDADTQVICYDTHANAYAGRLWWLLRWLGHERLAVLDGGMKAWESSNYAFDTTVPQIAATVFRGNPRNDMLVTTHEIAAQLDSHTHCLIDVRTAERFAGEKELLDPVAGHIPGARNLPYQSNLDAGDCYLPPEALKKMYRRVLDDIAPDHCIVMCGSGVTACQSLIALELAGMSGAKLYAGSWSEWIRDSARTVAVGGK
ncbi:MAG: sulfurtransferase [Gammaproteobacteria bacterium]|nr:sulfurtransferase [Gammaproteobacteria bacterium]